MRFLLVFLLSVGAWAQTSIRVNVGGPPYTDSVGNVWASDIGCSSATTWSRAVTIHGTNDPTLYQTGRSDPSSVGCAYNVTNTSFYNVVLKFTETDPAVTGVGQQIVNIFINNVLYRGFFDLVQNCSGLANACDLGFGPIPVTSGVINILVTQVTGGAQLSALDIEVTGGGGGGGSGAAQITVPFSATPTFTCSSNTINDFVLSTALSANITSSTLASCNTAVALNFVFTQAAATGPWTVAMPASFAQACQVSPIAGAVTKMSFWWDGTNAQLVNCAVDRGPSICPEITAPTGNPPVGVLFTWCDSGSHIMRFRNSGGGITQSAVELASGSIRKAGGVAGIDSPAVAADMVGLFSGCSGTLYLGADGACHGSASFPKYYTFSAIAGHNGNGDSGGILGAANVTGILTNYNAFNLLHATGDQNLYVAFNLPTGFSSVDLKVIAATNSGGTGNVVLAGSTACIADGSTMQNPTFNTATSQTTAAPNNGTRLQKTYSFTGLNITGCAANNTIFVKVFDNVSNGSYTYAGDLEISMIIVTVN